MEEERYPKRRGHRKSRYILRDVTVLRGHGLSRPQHVHPRDARQAGRERGCADGIECGASALGAAGALAKQMSAPGSKQVYTPRFLLGLRSSSASNSALMTCRSRPFTSPERHLR